VDCALELEAEKAYGYVSELAALGVVHDLIVEATEGGLVGHDERVEPLHVRLCESASHL
jgi:hypothetical protein